TITKITKSEASVIQVTNYILTKFLSGGMQDILSLEYSSSFISRQI
ncbi:13379_t:CDS:1, partial [Funneliformis geosporum]